MSLTRKLIAEVTGEETITKWKREIKTPALKSQEPVAEPKQSSLLKKGSSQGHIASHTDQNKFQSRWNDYWSNWRKLKRGLGAPAVEPSHQWGRGR